MTYIPGQPIQNSKQTANLTTSTLLSLGSGVQTVNMPGAIVGIHAAFALPMSDPGSLVMVQAWVSATDTVSVRMTNMALISQTASIPFLIGLTRVPAS